MARILIVEPDRNVRRLLAQIVTRLGHEAVAWESKVDAAHRGSQASAPPGDADVLLLDSDLPAALALGEDFRARRPRLPIICMSFREAPPRARELRPLACLLKPFSAAAVEEVIDEAVKVAGDTSP